MSSRMTSAPVPLSEHIPSADTRIVMASDWAGYEALLALRGEGRRPKLAYLDGAVELMTTSREHEWIKSWFGRLVEAYCFERDVAFSPCGEWTQRKKVKKAAAEPDESYIFGTDPMPVQQPDLVIEVVWTSGGLDKLEIYKRLGIGEVWFWIDDAISVHVLGPDGYTEQTRSVCLPDLDLAHLATFLWIRPASEAVKQYRVALRALR